MFVPSPSAPFADKMRFYRSQHTSRGVRATHLLGVPAIAAALPLVMVKPRVGLPMFAGGWALQLFGHVVFERNLPSTHKGWITYQLAGVVHVCEIYGEMLSRSSARRSARRARRLRTGVGRRFQRVPVQEAPRLDS
jgi:hypothetical protein